MSESENEEKGFKITDRRKFTPEGDPRPDAESVEEIKKPRVEEPGPTKTREARRPARDAGHPPIETSFADLVSMLASNALVQMGEVEDPISGERSENLQGVQVMISLLTMLETKTKGNLSSDEEKMLERVLYDLRMRFMAKTKSIKL